MGNTFMSALIPKKGRLAATIGHLKKVIAEVAGGEDAALELRANGGDRFYALNGNLVDPLEPELANALADAYARLSGTPALTVYGFDSDVSMVRLTDGRRQSAVLFGLADALEEELPPYIEQLWRPLFPTQRAWDVLENLRDRQARGVDASEDAFFAETAVYELAKALGFDGTAACGFPEESEAEVVWSVGERPMPEEIPEDEEIETVPEGEPPRLEGWKPRQSNPVDINLRSVGGRGRGIEVAIFARHFDAACCEIPDAGLFAARRSGWVYRRFFERAERISTQEGGGWRVLFPEAEILPGALHRERNGPPGFTLEFPVLGAGFALALIPSGREGLLVELPTGETGKLCGAAEVRIGDARRTLSHLEVRVAPMENPSNGVRLTALVTRVNENHLSVYNRNLKENARRKE